MKFKKYCNKKYCKLSFLIKIKFCFFENLLIIINYLKRN